MNSSTYKHWFQGIRIYIAIAIVVVSLETVWWALSAYGHTNLAAIRIEEIFAWLSVVLLSTALAIGPAYKSFPKLPAGSMMRDARRLFGVGAAWFALLHVSIAYIALFKTSNPLSLPLAYQYAFLWGGIAFLILLALAFTSFDAAFHSMGVWWFRLHRLIYPAALLVLLHAFMIGTHASSLLPLIILSVVSLAILLLQIRAAFTGGSPTKLQIITISLTALLLLVVLNYGLAQHLGHNLLTGQRK